MNGPVGAGHANDVVEAHAFGGEGVDVGRADVAAERPQVGVAQVVGDDEQQIGPRVGGRIRAGAAGSAEKTKQRQHDRGWKLASHGRPFACGEYTARKPVTLALVFVLALSSFSVVLPVVRGLAGHGD